MMLRGDVMLKNRTDYWETLREGDSSEAMGISLLAAHTIILDISD